jgi:hypothetical protein
MSTVKTLYGTTNQAITCTLASLANATGAYGAGRASTAVDNRTNLFLDALVQVQIKTSSSALANDKTVYVYAYGTVDDTDSLFTDGITGTDAGFTGTTPMNLNRIGVINAVAVSTTYIGGPWSVATAFGGVLPAQWGLFIVNFTGQALDSTEGNHKKVYQGIQSTVA